MSVAVDKANRSELRRAKYLRSVGFSETLEYLDRANPKPVSRGPSSGSGRLPPLLSKYPHLEWSIELEGIRMTDAVSIMDGSAKHSFPGGGTFPTGPRRVGISIARVSGLVMWFGQTTSRAL